MSPGHEGPQTLYKKSVVVVSLFMFFVLLVAMNRSSLLPFRFQVRLADALGADGA